MYIFSVSGLMNDRKISKEEAFEKTKHLKGKEMIMPSHPFKSNCYVNCTHFAENEKDAFFTGVNNAKGTQIFAFETVKIKDGIIEKKEDLEGELIILSGTLDEISVGGVTFPRFDLKFINGSYKVVKD